MTPEAGELDVICYPPTLGGTVTFRRDEYVWQNLGVPPSIERMGEADIVVVMGPIDDGNVALTFGGEVRIAVERGATIVFLYQGWPGSVDARFLQNVLSRLTPDQVGSAMRPPLDEPPPHPAFRDYLVTNGHNTAAFHGVSDEDEILGHSGTTVDHHPCALVSTIGEGRIYILPWHLPGVSGSAEALFDRLISSLQAHASGQTLPDPHFLADLEVAGERDVTTEIEDLSARVAAANERRNALLGHKQLVGRLKSGAFVSLVIEDLNLVLEGSRVHARSIEETFAEDFDLAREDDRLAIAEAKGVNSGVQLNHVDQLNQHRTKLFDVGADELPGLLVVNQHRLKDDLELRQAPVAPGVIKHALRINVLILRGWDLYELVNRRLRGEDDSGALITALEGGGGWLEVREDSATVHTD